MKDEKESMLLVDRVAMVAEVYDVVCQLCHETLLGRHKSSAVAKHIHILSMYYCTL